MGRIRCIRSWLGSKGELRIVCLCSRLIRLYPILIISIGPIQISVILILILILIPILIPIAIPRLIWVPKEDSSLSIRYWGKEEVMAVHNSCSM